jgi:hypothetical protein
MPFIRYNVEKYGETRKVTNDLTILRIRVACCISKATRTHARTQAHAQSHAPGHTHARTHTQICNISCFSQQQRLLTLLSITLCAHCLSCYLYFYVHYSVFSHIGCLVFVHAYRIFQLWRYEVSQPARYKVLIITLKNIYPEDVLILASQNSCVVDG